MGIGARAQIEREGRCCSRRHLESFLSGAGTLHLGEEGDYLNDQSVRGVAHKSFAK